MLEVIPCTRLVVDGLDECSHENQKKILKETQALRINSKLHLKILFSSREEVCIAAKLRGKPSISLSESRENVDRDIQSYVHHAFGKLQNKFQAMHLSEVESIVVERSKGILYPVKLLYPADILLGMFLWARLMVMELQTFLKASKKRR
jgi:hypothetical protein